MNQLRRRHYRLTRGLRLMSRTLAFRLAYSPRLSRIALSFCVQMKPASHKVIDRFWSYELGIQSGLAKTPAVCCTVQHLYFCSRYDLRVFVESDRTSTLQTAIDRGLGGWETEWRELFLPSVDLYMSTEAEDRADILVGGRGA